MKALVDDISSLRALKTQLHNEKRPAWLIEYELNSRMMKSVVEELGVTDYELEEVKRGDKLYPRISFILDGEKASLMLDVNNDILLHYKSQTRVLRNPLEIFSANSLKWHLPRIAIGQ